VLGTAVRWRKIGTSLRLTRKNVSNENEHVEHDSPSMPTIKREDADQLHLRDAVTSFLV
jgi:hypothetical protein